MLLGLVAAQAADTPSLTVATSSLFAVLGLVALNGFFVAAEFSLVATRRSKLDEMIAKGDRGAKVVQTALQHLGSASLRGPSSGSRIASLALGWIGEPILADLIDGLFRKIGVNPSPTAIHVAAVSGRLLHPHVLSHRARRARAEIHCAHESRENGASRGAPAAALFAVHVAPDLAVQRRRELAAEAPGREARHG